jgi:beta-N-acetylhexosaminidase
MRSRCSILLVALALLTGCAPSASPTAPPTPTLTVTPAPTPTPTVDPIAGLTLAHRVGQLFMIGTAAESADPVTLAAVTDRHIGGIFLHGRTQAGVAATMAVVAQFTSLVSPETTAGVPLWVSTDQEGGEVQVLSGPGFDAIPSAVEQGQLPAATLLSDAATWGGQLAQAGVNMNLAPVADIVTSPAAAHDNDPIGALNRQYGYDEQTVAAQAGAFAEGMRQAGILPTFKHFPGLGRTTSNTDYSSEVIDSEIDQNSPDVDVYRSLLAGGPAVVMVSTAIYQKIDPSSPAAFSAPVVTGLLRGELGYDGVVITDDVSAAKSVSGWTSAQRATMAISAGCDVVLASADPTVVAEMYDAVLATAQSDPEFAAKVDAAARRVVIAKQSKISPR